MFDRHPNLKMVSVESGIGWVPFMLEAMDYELEENAPEWFHKLEKLPSEYFRDNWYATFWFETGRGDLQHLIDAVGEDNVMFETDFPAPDQPAPESPRDGEGQDRHPATRDPAQGDGRERRQALPPVAAPDQPVVAGAGVESATPPKVRPPADGCDPDRRPRTTRPPPR